jgi:hypothetical protein
MHVNQSQTDLAIVYQAAVMDNQVCSSKNPNLFQDTWSKYKSFDFVIFRYFSTPEGMVVL